MFFRYFPTIAYKTDNHNSVLTDITISFLQKRIFLNKSYNFRRYTVIEGERPEEVSYKLYNTVRFHWVLLFLNNIIDPMTDWFMSSDLLLDFTAAKYPEIQNDPTNSSGIYGINHYRWYYDESDISKYQRLDNVDEKPWRYRGGRNYKETDQIIINLPESGEESDRATAYINRVDELGTITDITINNPGANYIANPNFTILSDDGNKFQGEIIIDGNNRVKEFKILPIGEQIHPISNLHVETELNANRREIIAITPEHIIFLEEQLYSIMGQI